MNYYYYESPIGELLLAGDKDYLKRIEFPMNKVKVPHGNDWLEDKSSFKEVIRQLKAYFTGDLKNFTLPLQPATTPFRMNVLSEVKKIPYGQTATYGEIAEKIGKPRASRAVGGANANNPIPIIIPCHRVIGSSGKLTGFGGGIPLKQELINLEKQNC